jgi:hypothetical protein
MWTFPLFSYLFDYINKLIISETRTGVGITHALSREYLVNKTPKNMQHSNARGNVMSDLERVVKEAEILKWAEENRRCKLNDVPHWIIMALMEDIVYFDCHLVEQLVMALNGSWGAVMQDGYLEHATEKLMTNILLASLHEDGYIEISPGLMDDPRLFDFDHNLDVQVSLTPSGKEAQVWDELNLFEPIPRQAELQ